VSTPTTRPAPLRRNACTADSPTPPRPITAADWPGTMSARLNTAPAPVVTPHGTRQAEVSGTSLGIVTHWISLTSVISAYVEAFAKFHTGSPPTEKGAAGLPSVWRQRLGWPVWQYWHIPHAAIVVITTWSPGTTAVTPAPIFSTTPAPSWPSTAGAGHAITPSSTLTSLWHTPVAAMRTSTSPASGARTSTSSRVSTPFSVCRIARIFHLLAAVANNGNTPTVGWGRAVGPCGRAERRACLRALRGLPRSRPPGSARHPGPRHTRFPRP
jgi:hypothetical protein